MNAAANAHNAAMSSLKYPRRSPSVNTTVCQPQHGDPIQRMQQQLVATHHLSTAPALTSPVAGNWCPPPTHVHVATAVCERTGAHAHGPARTGGTTLWCGTVGDKLNVSPATTGGHTREQSAHAARGTACGAPMNSLLPRISNA